jgi:hypothetical protein
VKWVCVLEDEQDVALSLGGLEAESKLVIRGSVRTSGRGRWRGTPEGGASTAQGRRSSAPTGSLTHSTICCNTSKGS